MGIVLSVLGFFLAVARYKFNYQPDFLNVKLFAFYSFYIESKSFTIISNQLVEEIAQIVLVSGLFIIAFTREKEETEEIDVFRLKAFVLTAYVNLVYLLLATLFFFGFGFVATLIIFSVSWLAVYILVFRYLLFRSRARA